MCVNIPNFLCVLCKSRVSETATVNCSHLHSTPHEHHGHKPPERFFYLAGPLAADVLRHIHFFLLPNKRILLKRRNRDIVDAKCYTHDLWESWGVMKSKENPKPKLYSSVTHMFGWLQKLSWNLATELTNFPLKCIEVCEG